MPPLKLSDLPVANNVETDQVQWIVSQDGEGHLYKTRLRELFADEDAATLHLVADVLERRGSVDPAHLARLRKVGVAIRGLLQFDTAVPPSNQKGTSMSKRLDPTDDRLVIRPKEIKGEERTESGIYLTEGAREKPAEGTVIAMGPGRREGKMRLPIEAAGIGDVVAYGKYSGVEITVDKEQLLIVREVDILGVLR